MTTLEEFRDVLRAMMNLDRPDLQAVGLFGPSDSWKYRSGNTDYEWGLFRDDPYGYALNASDEDCERIFMAVLNKLNVKS